MNASELMPAAVLAGGDSSDRVAAHVGAPCKALVEVEGRPMVRWVADAVEGAAGVSDAVVAEGPQRPVSSSPEAEGLTVVAAEGAGFIDTLLAAVQALPDAERVLVATADLPLLTPEAVDGFIGACQEVESEVSYPLVRAEEFERAFPGRGKTVVRLREGRFAAANLAVLARQFILEQGPVIASTFARRKSPLGLCRMFGWGFIVRMLLGRLSVADLERRGSRMLDARLAAVPVGWPEIGFDVDDVDDLELARRFVRKREGSS